MLGRGDLVVLGLGEDAELPQLIVQILHIGEDAWLDAAKVVIIQLLTLWGTSSEQGASGVNQILALGVQLLGDEEIFLLGTDRGDYLLDVLVAEQLQYTQCLDIQRLHRAQERGFLIQRVGAVGRERGGDT